MPEPRKLRVFLCHSSQDKPIVRELCQRLLAEGWIDPWLDEEKLLPGQDWDLEIEKAVENADVVIVCLSNKSVTKEGYVQRELKFALEIALEKPEGTIFIIPVRLDECIVPRRVREWQYVDYYPTGREELAFTRLLNSLKQRALYSSQLAKEVERTRITKAMTLIQSHINDEEHVLNKLYDIRSKKILSVPQTGNSDDLVNELFSPIPQWKVFLLSLVGIILVFALVMIVFIIGVMNDPSLLSSETWTGTTLFKVVIFQIVIGGILLVGIILLFGAGKRALINSNLKSQIALHVKRRNILLDEIKSKDNEIRSLNNF